MYCNKISISELVIKTPGVKINLVIAVTRPRGLKLAVDLKGSSISSEKSKQRLQLFHPRARSALLKLEEAAANVTEATDLAENHKLL